jgi:hypothetical protein
MKKKKNIVRAETDLYGTEKKGFSRRPECVVYQIFLIEERTAKKISKQHSRSH